MNNRAAILAGTAVSGADPGEVAAMPGRSLPGVHAANRLAIEVIRPAESPPLNEPT